MVFYWCLYATKRETFLIDSFHRREAIDKDYNATRINNYHRINRNYKRELFGLCRPHPVLTREFVEEFDLIYSNQAKYIISNWEIIKHKPIIWRTIGSLEKHYELQMKPLIEDGNVTPVRFSPLENLYPESNEGYCIRNFVDENLYTDWSGGINRALTFQNWFQQRSTLKFGAAYLQMVEKIPCSLYGLYAGPNHVLNNGPVSWDKQREMYQKYNVYMYMGSEAAIVAYNFLEAMMTGTPLLSFGDEIGGSYSDKVNKVLHEPTDILENGVNGFISNDLDELAQCARELFKDERLRKNISQNARQTALRLFSKERAVKEWKEFYKMKFGVSM